MLWIDTAILVLIGMFAFGGLLRGSSRELFAIFIWLVGVVVGWFFSQNFALLLVKFSPTESERIAFSFLALIGITVVLGWMIYILLADTIKKSGIGILGRLGGMFLGAIHGGVIVFAMILLAGLTPLPKDSWWRQSHYIPYFQEFVVFMKQNSASKLATLIHYPFRLNLQAK